ncbi:MAG: hypothetical protein CSA72_06520 [Rhodobacterales bacterium]|nr:MAG: hypothetical protein CSA72_06520 [Rhodobacterales bacterium]
MREALIFLALALPAQAQEVTEGETLAFRLAFDDCMGHVLAGAEPFTDLPQIPLTDEARSTLPRGARHPGVTTHHLWSDRYTAIWGQDDNARLCMILSNGASDAPMQLLVDPDGFLDRVSARADQIGLTEHELPETFTPLATTSWHEPGPLQGGLRLTIMPTGDKGGLSDAGLIIVAAPIPEPPSS